MRKSTIAKVQYSPTVLRKKLVVTLRNGVPIIIPGTFDPTVHSVRDFVSFEHPVFGVIHASLIRVDHRVLWYRQVLKEATTNDQGGKTHFNPSQK